MQPASFYLIEGVPGAWQFWSESEDPDHCWLAPADAAAKHVELRRAHQIGVQASGQFLLVPTGLLRPTPTGEQPRLF